MIAIDWSHTKGLTTYDGQKIRTETLKELSHMTEDKVGEESRLQIKPNLAFQLPTVVLEQGCPLSLCYALLRVGTTVSLIDNKATEQYRKANGIERMDENDARIIYELAQNGAKLQELNLTSKMIQLYDIYHQYCRYQKARVALQNMKKAHLRHYAIGKSRSEVKSSRMLQPIAEDGTGESRPYIKSRGLPPSARPSTLRHSY